MTTKTTTPGTEEGIDLDTATLWEIHGVVKNAGSLDLAHKIADSIARRAAPLAHPIGQVKQERAQLSGALEAIAQSWDECICDGIGEDREIGTVLREQFARVVAPSSTDSAQAAVEEVRNQALEEAARACVAERVVNTGDDTDTAYNMATSHCAKAIRALKSTAAQAATQGDKS
jgi:hypothetical protein